MEAFTLINSGKNCRNGRNRDVYKPYDLYLKGVKAKAFSGSFMTLAIKWEVMSYLNLYSVISQFYLKNKNEFEYAIKKGKEGVLQT